MVYNKPNIIVIVADALRADHLSCYGYPTLTSPYLDRFAERCVLFESAFSASPSTVSSIPSILTGLYPSLHGTGVDGNMLTLNRQVTTLPELLKQHGYTTVAFNTNPLVAGKYGYDRGYDARFDLFPAEKDKAIMTRIDYILGERSVNYLVRLSQPYICSKQLNACVADWLKRKGRRPFFMWLHYMDTHSPYLPRQPYFSQYSLDKPREKVAHFLRQFDRIVDALHKGSDSLGEVEKALVIDCYDSEIRYLDRNLGQLMSLLSGYNLLDNTVIFITADHGEEFWEHGKWGHFVRMYDINLRVPLLLKLPGFEAVPKRICAQVRNIDIFATIVDLLQGRDEQGLSGLSLLAWLNGNDSATEEPVIAEGGGVERLSTGEYIDRMYAIRTKQYKYIKNVTKNEFQLYRLSDDPQELNNIAVEPSAGQIIARLEGRMNELLNPAGRLDTKMIEAEIDDQMLKRLKALGYA